MKRLYWPLIWLLLFSLSACRGTLEVGVERTPTPAIPLQTWSGRSGLIYRAGDEVYLLSHDEERPVPIGPLPADAGRVTLGTHYLAYTSDGRIQALDLRDGATIVLYDAGQRPGQDFDLCWSSDGTTLVYAVAWDGADGARVVELGVTDGYEQRVIDVLTAAPLPKAEFANLHVLGYSRAEGRLVVQPVGGVDRSAVWVYDARTGEQSYTLMLPGDTLRVALAPHTYQLAFSRPGELEAWSLESDAPPQTVALPTETHAGWLSWSPDGRRLAYLLHEGATPGLAVSAGLGVWVWEVENGSGRLLVEGIAPEMALHNWTGDGSAVLVEALEGISRQRTVRMVDAWTGAVTHVPLCEGCRVVGWRGSLD